MIRLVRRMALFVLVAAWAAVAVMVAFPPGVDSRMRLGFMLAVGAAVSASSLWVLLWVLGDYTKAYLLGFHDGTRAATGQGEGDARPFLRVIGH